MSEKLFCDCSLKCKQIKANPVSEVKQDLSEENQEWYEDESFCEVNTMSDEDYDLSIEREQSIASTLSGEDFWEQNDFGGRLTTCDCHRIINQQNINDKKSNKCHTQCSMWNILENHTEIALKNHYDQQVENDFESNGKPSDSEKPILHLIEQDY